MPKKHLSDRFIRTLKAPDKRTEYYDQHLIDPATLTIKKSGVKGLALRATKAGSKSFVYRYWYDGKSKRYKIGSYPKVRLSEAREIAKELAAKVDRGLDPLAEKNKKKHQSAPQTFTTLADEFKQKHLPGLRESTRDEYKRIIDVELTPVLGKYPANEITKQQVLRILDDKAYGDDSPTMANRIRARLSKIFSFGMERGLVDKNPVQHTSPYSEGETKRDRYYDEEEIKELWQFFDQWGEPTGSSLKMLLVCGQRSTETMHMRWSDIKREVWTIPAELAKNKQPHDVPLPSMALQILDHMKKLSGDSDYVFASPMKENTPLDSLSRVRQAIQKSTGVSDFRPHDLRRTVATYMAKLKVDRTVLGKILNHKGLAGDGQVTAIYDRHSYMEEKREAMDKWSDKLQEILLYKQED